MIVVDAAAATYGFRTLGDRQAGNAGEGVGADVEYAAVGIAADGDMACAGAVQEQAIGDEQLARCQRNGAIGAGGKLDHISARRGVGFGNCLAQAACARIVGVQHRECVRGNLHGADVAAVAAAGIGEVGNIGHPGQPALIGVAGQRRDGIPIALVKHRAAAQGGVGEGRAAVVLQGAEQRVDVDPVRDSIIRTGGVAAEVVAERGGRAEVIIVDRAAQTAAHIQDGIPDLHRGDPAAETFVVDGAADLAGRVAAEGAGTDGQRWLATGTVVRDRSAGQAG